MRALRTAEHEEEATKKPYPIVRDPTRPCQNRAWGGERKADFCNLQKSVTGAQSEMLRLSEPGQMRKDARNGVSGGS